MSASDSAATVLGVVLGVGAGVAALAVIAAFVVYGWRQSRPWPVVEERRARKAALARRAAVATALQYGEAHDA